MRILLVEDDYLQADWITQGIQLEFPTSAVVRISTEQEFRSSFDNIVMNPPDVVIMGVMLRWTDPSPEMESPPSEIRQDGFYRAGFRCTRLVLQDFRTRKIPIVLYTLMPFVDLEPALRDMPENVVYLSKDGDSSTLTKLIRRLGEEGKKGEEETEEQEQIAIAFFGDKIKLVSLTPEGTYRFLDESDNLHSILYVVSSETRALETAVEEMESLMNNCKSKEKDIQEFFERNPDFILNDEYKRAHPHLTLTKEGGTSLIPDFVLEPVDQNSLCDLLELKLPSARAFISQKNRARFSAGVLEACAQLRAYSDFFDEVKNRKSIQEKYGLLAYKPKMFVIIGRRGKLNPIDTRRITSDLPNLHLVTYDDITARMKARIEAMKRGRFRG